VVGFGIAHLLIKDNNNFTLFLIIDIALVVGAVVLSNIPGICSSDDRVAGVSGLHIYQGLDAYGKAGGQKIVQWTRENAVEVASSEDRRVPITTRAFALQF